MFYSSKSIYKHMKSHIDLDVLAKDIIDGLVFTTADFINKDDFTLFLTGVFTPLAEMSVKRLKTVYNYGDGVLFFYQYRDKRVLGKEVKKYPVFDSCYQLNKEDYDILIATMQELEGLKN